MEKQIIDDKSGSVRPLVVSVAEARLILGCGHDQVYDLIHAGELRSFLIGRRRKILMASVEAYVAKCAAAADGAFQKAVNSPPVPPLGPRKRPRKRGEITSGERRIT